MELGVFSWTIPLHHNLLFKTFQACDWPSPHLSQCITFFLFLFSYTHHLDKEWLWIFVYEKEGYMFFHPFTKKVMKLCIHPHEGYEVNFKFLNVRLCLVISSSQTSLRVAHLIHSHKWWKWQAYFQYLVHQFAFDYLQFNYF